MQTLKEDVRQSILRAALNEFKTHDYMDASMRRISAAAGVTTGNIYRYYKNKEELFEALVRPVYEKLIEYVLDVKKELDRSYTGGENDGLKYLNMVEDTIIDLFDAYSAELTILLNRSAGSKYGQVKSDLVALIVTILEDVFTSGREDGDKLTTLQRQSAQMLAGTVVEGVCLILREYEDGETVKRLVNEFIFLYHKGLEHQCKL
ncbi:TetR/AcrR family transcriptional regulator [Paenibacillus sp.]|jgi:AcrR family transcriptional regulator|uniref:TetR/AcrR family transcriptional regulator n=1 Tax=Paenibacillus sp. TaxID=58172 RepID=UPI002828B807|nr:TetR/AcrR family transcriptional regulator [Paenibacillus sp.]MDR0270394.1 TetR/AcrR family transcriptional regulator [Paenibacillus sp.]